MWCLSLTTRNSRNRNTTHQIPLDVILEILTWLPAKSALRFKSVCKEWYNLINSPLFAKLHLNKSLQSDSKQNQSLLCSFTLRVVDDLYRPSRWKKLNWPKDIIRLDNAYCVVVGSCNGLVCFKIGTVMLGPLTLTSFLICNPTTGTYKLILPSSGKNWAENCLSCGFGYDSEHDDYKIVVTSSVWTECDRDVRIYSVKADLWSCPTPPPNRISSGRIWENRVNVIFKDKMLHYLVSTEVVGNGRSQLPKDYRIARFDVVTEKWRDDLYFPAQLKKNPVKLGELDGLLYLRGGSYLSEVWMMEEDGSWKKMFDIPKKFSRHQLIAISKDGRHRLLLQDLDDCGDLKLKWYDHQTSKTVPFALKVPAWYSSVMLCIASLVTIPGCSSEKLYDIKEKRAKRRLLDCIVL